MKQHYYLKIEIRYSYFNEEGEHYPSKFISSKLFDEKEECIKYGNKIIEANKWIEQYPGHIGRRIREDTSLIAPSLKNGTTIFIQIKKLDIYDFEEVNTELRKFNISKIGGKIS